jgi:hypothetical protein
MEEHKTSSTVLVWPVLIRLSLLLVGPILEFSFHKLAHMGIHLSIERFDWLKQMVKRWRYLPDALMICALVVLHFVS